MAVMDNCNLNKKYMCSGIRIAIFVVLFVLLISKGFAQQFSFEFEGIERSYIVHLPPGYDDQVEYPLVVNMHGLGSNAFQQQLYSEFDDVADTADIVVVYPNGVSNQWNIFSDDGINDVGFISALIDTMAINYTIELNRVYATGMSMGGFMSHRLACQLNDKIAAIASVTGTLAYAQCSPGRPFPVLQIHGTADSTVPYDLVPFTMAFWINQNTCLDTTVTELPDIDTTDQSTVTKMVYSPCDEEVEVVLYRINGGEHTWPGAPIEIGITNYDIEASIEIWNFFSQYTLPETVDVYENYLSQDKMLIYPQPVKNAAIIKLPVENDQHWNLRLMDFSGRVIRNKYAGFGTQVSIVREGLKPGIYIIELSSTNRLYREKIIF